MARELIHLASRDTLVTTFRIDEAQRQFVDTHWQEILDMAGEVIPHIRRGKAFESTASRSNRINQFIGLIEAKFQNISDQETYLRCGMYACLLLFLSSKSFRFDFGEFCKHWKSMGMGELNHLAHYVGTQVAGGTL